MRHIKLAAAGPYHLVNPADPARTQCGRPVDPATAVDTITGDIGNRPQCAACWMKRPHARTQQEE